MPLLPGFLATAYAFMLGLSVPLFASNPDITIEYDQQRDKISIEAQNSSLTAVLSEVAKKTNITIRIDPAVEKTVNFQLPPQSLQQALQKIVKGLSYVIEYKTDEKKRTVISGMKLLPKGKQDSGQLVPVSVLNARASRYGGGRNNDKGIFGSQDRNYYPDGRQSGTIRRSKRPVEARPETLSPYDQESGDVNVIGDNEGNTSQGKLKHTK